jgi:hypothetical protein
LLSALVTNDGVAESLGCHGIAKKLKRGNPTKETKKLPMGLRWPVERTNSWLSTIAS